MNTLRTLTLAGAVLATFAAVATASAEPQSGWPSDEYNSASGYTAASTADRSGSYYYGPRVSRSVANEDRSFASPTNRLQVNPDRPYGNPDNW